MKHDFSFCFIGTCEICKSELKGRLDVLKVWLVNQVINDFENLEVRKMGEKLK